MSKVLVKAYIPTIDEKRGISLDDIIDGGSLRYVRPGERNIGMNARNLSRNQRTGVGSNIPYEIESHKLTGGKSIPGLLDLDNPTQINPNFNIEGTYVGPPNQGFLRRPDMSFRRTSPAVLLASTQNPEWWRTMSEGALTPAEGYKYGGFDKDTVVEIPLPKGLSTPQHLVYPTTQDAHDFLSQFPSEVGSQQWANKLGQRMDINQLIAGGKLQPLSLDQRIQPHESPFLEDDVTRKVASEPMNLALRLLKTRIASPNEEHPQIGRTVFNPDTNEVVDSSVRVMPTEDGRHNHPNNFIRDVIHEDMHVATLPELDHTNIAQVEYPAFLGEEIYSQRLAEEGKSERPREPYNLERTTPYNQALYRIGNHPNVPIEDRVQAKQAWYDDIETGEPMDIGMRLLKFDEDEWFRQHQAEQQRIAEAAAQNRAGMRDETRSVPCTFCGAGIGEPCIGSPYRSHSARTLALGRKRMGSDKQTGEPMDIAMRLLKENIDYQDEDYIYPHEQIWNDEADDQLIDTTNSLWDYVENMSNDDKIEWLRLQGNPFMQRGMQRMYGDFPELNQQDIDDSIWEMMFDAWQDSQLEMPGGIDFDIGGNRESRQTRDPTRAHAIHPNYWKKLASEPMDIAFQLLKEELSRVQSSPTVTRQKRTIVANQNPANLPCPMCDGRILQQPCQKCGRLASLGAGTLKSDISKNLNRWFKEKWVDVSRKNKDGKHPPCGRSKAKKSSKGYPKCRPSVKVSSKTPKTSGSMSQGQKQAATKRKRAKKQGVGGKPTIVKSFVRVI